MNCSTQTPKRNSLSSERETEQKGTARERQEQRKELPWCREVNDPWRHREDTAELGEPRGRGEEPEQQLPFKVHISRGMLKDFILFCFKTVSLFNYSDHPPSNPEGQHLLGETWIFCCWYWQNYDHQQGHDSELHLARLSGLVVPKAIHSTALTWNLDPSLFIHEVLICYTLWLNSLVAAPHCLSW